jgi:hypothetical protein
MDKLQFLVLYRQFLFRMVDLEILSPQAQGDMGKLFGQFASLMISISVGFAIIGLSSSGGRLPPLPRVLFQWTLEHFLIAATMLIAGIFALLSWDATFPDKRDVMALGPLPIRPRTLFLAKITGVGLALSLAVITLHSLCSFTFIGGVNLQPAIVFAGQSIPQTGGFIGFIRTFAAYWTVMFAAAAFIFGCVLTLQGIAALLLPRTLYLRASSGLQLTAFCVMVCGALLEPTEANPRSLAAAQGNGFAAWQFTFWFLGLFQEIKGSSALPILAHRAWLGLASIALLTAAVYSLAYFRMMRKIVEEPDILPSARGLRWLPSFGNSFQTAIGQFSIHSLLRSRQHRMILAFYLGIAFAANVLLLRMPAARDRANSWAVLGAPLLATTIISMLVSVVGMRIAFAMPLDLKANWIFRIAPVRGGLDCLRARRRAILAAGLVPVWITSVIVLFWLWPWRAAAAHLLILGLLGAITAEICLLGFQKIPFTCSYLPGKTNIHVTFLFSTMVILQLIAFCAGWERRAIENPFAWCALIVGLAVALCILRRLTAVNTDADDIGIQYEDEGSPAIQTLGLAGR